VIRKGYDRELDEWRAVESGASDWLEAYLAKIRVETGLPKMKTGYNKIYGYYLEVSKAALSGVSLPSGFVRKQTLVNAERFVTEEIVSFEGRMRSAGEEIAKREGVLYDALVAKTLGRVGDIQALGDALASLDVLASLAEVAREKRYARPVMNEGFDLSIVHGRHPVVEDVLAGGAFVPNSLRLERSAKRIALLTGPNMAGKSTYLRMAALLVLMAQMGGFIPAEAAEMGVCDRIFTRIGARDDLAAGSSTFMVEMVETANILHNMTDRSLVILDEVGRGTSTYDGMSIAWAVLEYLAEGQPMEPKVLFATHYHELCCLEERFPQIENLSMAVREENGSVSFLHQVVRGSADRSYGIEVARLAGVPQPVLNRAFDLLQRFEREERVESSPAKARGQGESLQLPLFHSEHHGIVEELASLSPDKTTPFRALELLYKLHEKSREVLRSENTPSS
jgi:DNA mismatch repair protein MutS